MTSQVSDKNHIRYTNSTMANTKNIDIDVAMEMDLYPQVKTCALQMCTPSIYGIIAHWAKVDVSTA